MIPALLALTLLVAAPDSPPWSPADDGLPRVYERARLAGFVRRGEAFAADFGDRYRFELDPDDLGWTIVIRDRGRPGDDLAAVTTPFYGVRSVTIEGWHFRNNDNTGPNLPDEKNVNAPGEIREFRFSPWVGLTYMVPWATYKHSDLDVEELYEAQEDGFGVVRITDLELGNLVPNEQAWIERMAFEVSLAWRDVDTSWSAPAAETRATRLVRRLYACAYDSALPWVSLDAWLGELLGETAPVAWRLTDCGEQTGHPEIDRVRDIPTCVEAEFRVPDGRTAYLSFYVGTTRRGIFGRPEHGGTLLVEGDDAENVPALGLLPAAIRPPPAIPLAAAAALRATHPRFRPWRRGEFIREVVRDYSFGADQALWGVTGDFNGDGAADVVLDGRDDLANLRIALLSREGEYDAVVVESQPRTNPVEDWYQTGEGPTGISYGRSTFLVRRGPGRVETQYEDAPIDLRTDAFEEVHYGKASVLHYWRNGRFQEYVTSD